MGYIVMLRKLAGPVVVTKSAKDSVEVAEIVSKWLSERLEPHFSIQIVSKD